jgi:hypothetical protein
LMFIILVFLINSYGSNPIQVKASPDLMIPRSTTELTPQDTLQITITAEKHTASTGTHVGSSRRYSPRCSPLWSGWAKRHPQS